MNERPFHDMRGVNFGPALAITVAALGILGVILVLVLAIIT